jgi:ABC-2 type transport system ATP-binding protein
MGGWEQRGVGGEGRAGWLESGTERSWGCRHVEASLEWGTLVSIPAISIRHLTKEFEIPFKRERLIAVRDLSFEVPEGEVYGLLGPNGSGKSTTMKILLGLVRPTSGSTAIFGCDSTQVESREQVGFLPENPYLYKFLTGLETLLFFGKLCGLRGALLRDRARELLHRVGLENAADRRLGGFSKGMLQRIGMAQALMQRPRLLVLDEPTAGVDPAGSREIRDMILEFKQQGITVLLCSHLLGQVQEVCDRVGILNRGRLLEEGRIEDLVTVENQTQLVLENATPELLREIERRVRESGARVITEGRRQADLEQYFLRVTRVSEAAEAAESGADWGFAGCGRAPGVERERGSGS